MRAYRLLLHLYPASFRREYASELAAMFGRRLRGAGAAARVGLWAEAVADVLANALRLHLELLGHDVRYGLRVLARAPGFTMTAVLVTALGIGANTAAFSVADFVFLRPLPYADADRLVTVWQHPPGYRLELSPPNYRDWKAMSTSFEAMGAWHGAEVNFLADGRPERLSGAAVTPDLLPILGVGPEIGRLPGPADEREGPGGAILLSHALWQRLFGDSPSALGRVVRLDGSPYEIIGVMPSAFSFPTREVAFWTLMPREERLNDERDNYWFHGLGKLKPGVTVAAANADLSVVADRLARAYPAVNEKIGATVMPLREEYSEQSELMLLALCGATLSVLLLACANLAGLFVARSHARRRELELRAALGAGRERLVRQLVTESLIVAAAGGALGLLVAAACVPLLSLLIPTSLPVANLPALDLRALTVAGVLTIGTGLGFGVVPAFRSSASDDFSALRQGVRGGGLRGLRVRSGLVVVEVMASIVLLIWAGLLMRALHQISLRDPGFRTADVLTMRTALPRPKYELASRREQFFDQVLTRVRSLPGVTNAAYVSFLPMTMGGGIFPVGLPGEPAAMHTGRVASMRFTTPGYFSTLGIPLLRGRDVRDTDTLSQPLVAVVSRSFVESYLPGEDALGKQVDFLYATRTIVGIVGDVLVRGPERRSEPQVYLPYRQVDDGSFPFFTPKDLAVQSSLPPDVLVPALRQIIAAADPEQPVSSVRELSTIVAEQTELRTVQVRVLAAFALVALVLAAFGIHGLLAFTVTQRRHEIGVRMALGADPGRIVTGILRQSALLALAGLVPGVLLAYAGGRLMQALLAGVAPGDAMTFGIAAALCALTTILGSLAPAVRAVQVQPASVFRSE